MDIFNLKIMENYAEDDYKEFCKIADYMGMGALSEDEQYVVTYWHRYERYLEEKNGRK